MNRIRHLLSIFLFVIAPLTVQHMCAQVIYASDNNSPSNLWQIRFTGNGACIITQIGSMGIDAIDIGVCQENPQQTIAFATDGQNFYTMDINTGATTLVGNFQLPPGESIVGLECGLDGIYGVGRQLYRINFFTGRAEPLGGLPLGATGDLVLHNGRYYYNGFFGLYELNIDDPGLSQQVMVGPLVGGLTGNFENCKQIIGGDAGGVLYNFNVLTQTWEQLDCGLEAGITGMANADNYAPAERCDTFDIDLDFDDSSGADDFDYIGETVDCIDTVIAVVDNDARIAATEAVDSIEVYLVGALPDAPLEYLRVQSAPNIEVSGNGTDRLVLRDGGGASEQDFEFALRNIRYHNNASPPTPGLRELRVQYTSFPNGYKSNLAFAEFDVISSVVDVDIGGDVRVCEGEEVTFNAGNPGFNYAWSTGSELRQIAVENPGKYIVTVTDPGTRCYGRDSAILFNDTFVNIKFIGEDTICEREEAFFTVQTGYPGTFDVIVESQFGGQFFQFFNVADGDLIEFLPLESAPFEATEVFALDGPSCFNLDSAFFSVEVIPDEFVVVNDTICNGDSIFLNGDWRFETGDYVEIYTSEVGCDSTHFALLQVLPTSETALTFGACNPADTGLFIEVLAKENGCDSTIITDVFLLRSDTTTFIDQTCDPEEAGIDTLYLTNALGCDSLIITERPLVEEDTTYVSVNTCNLDEIGFDTVELQGDSGCDSLVITEFVFVERDETLINLSTCDPGEVSRDTIVLTNKRGCDSLVITAIRLDPSDTTRLFFESCDPEDAGADTTVLTNRFGCDSLVIAETALLRSDTSRLDAITCDRAEAGIDTSVFSNALGCDSIVITNTTFVLADTTLFFDSSCQPSDTGTVVEQFTGQSGCDSFVITRTDFVLADTTLLFTESCNPSDTGVTMTIEVDSDGCDSIVITTISLLPSSSTLIQGTTCNPAEVRDDTVTLTNTFGCDSTVIFDISFVPLDTLFLSETTCVLSDTGTFTDIFLTADGCDSVVVTRVIEGSLSQCSLDGIATGDTIDCIKEFGSLIIDLAEGQLPFMFEWTNLSTGDQGSGQHNGPARLFTIEALNPGEYEVLIEDALGAKAIFTVSIVEILPPEISIQLLNEYNGFGVSCNGFSDGALDAEILRTGQSPFIIGWSTGDAGTSIDDLDADTYSATITDARGCTGVDSIRISEPDSLIVDFDPRNQDCRDGFGSVLNVETSGGAGDYLYFLNGILFDGRDRSDLEPGDYTLAVEDANGCRVDSTFTVGAAIPPQVSLGPDITVDYADTFSIEVLTGVPRSRIDSIIWSDGNCTDCDIRELVFFEDGRVGVTLIRDDGCSSMATVDITTIFNDNIFVPNAFSPNDDGINDRLRLYEGGQVNVIEEWIIYDRFGARVFEVREVDPDNEVGHWNGSFEGEAYDNQVFAYYVRALMNDGTTRELTGEVYIIR